MDETNLFILNLRVLNFFRDMEGKTISFSDIKDKFSYNEIIKILENPNHYTREFQKTLEELPLDQDFQDMINNKSRLSIENDSIPSYIRLASDDVILESIKEFKPSMVNYHISFLKTNEALVKSLQIRSIRKDKFLISTILCQLTDDNLKLKYLHLADKNNVVNVLATFKDEKLIAKVIDKYPKETGPLISKIENEDMRIYYYERNFSKLDAYSKGSIFRTLTEENKIKYLDRYWKKLSSEEKTIQLANIKNDEYILEKIDQLTDQEKIELIHKLGNKRQELIPSIASTITYNNSRRLVKYMVKNYLNSTMVHINANKLLEGTNDRRKLKMIKDDSYSPHSIVVLSTIKRFKSIEKYINHAEGLPEYNESFDSLVIRYAQEYNLNADHLIKIIRLTGLDTLKNIRSEKIQKLVNLDEETFNKLIGLFDPEKHKMDSNTINDNINIYSQRSFKLKNPNIINISSHIRLAIQNGEKEAALKLIDQIVSEFDITQILKNNNFTSEEFINRLVSTTNPDRETLTCLLAITSGYIDHKRNEYLRENLETFQQSFCRTSYDPKSAQKFMIENFPISVFRDTIFNEKVINLENGSTQEEIEFVKHPTALETIIQFRRNPSQFKGMPPEAKQYMKVFNKLFEKNFSNRIISMLPTDGINKIYTPIEYVDPNMIRDVLLDLDVDILKKGILGDEELFKTLEKTLTKYKLFGFNENMKTTFSSADLWIDGTTLSCLINYFPVVYEDLKEKLEKGEINSITLTGFLDMAQCYSMSSNKLARVFGADNIRLLSSNPGHNAAPMSKEERITKAQKYLKIMHERKYVSVPPVDEDLELSNGKKMNVVIGNVSEPINLTYGERTDACMRIGGHADSLFDFCLRDDNGFHIRFSSPDDDSFVSRVSGFRNGNTVFLNELRFSVDGRYSNDDVREACIMAAQLLIEKSKDSPTPIENVVIAPEYVMANEKTTPLNVSEVKKGVGSFYTDVTSDNATILATSNPDNKLVPIKLGNGGVQKYPVQRGKVRMYEGEKCIQHLDRIEIVDQIISGKSIDQAEPKPKKDIAFCYCGEDWYVTIDSKGNVGEYIMASSNKKELAIQEKDAYVAQIRERLGHSNEDTNTNSVGGVRR